MKAVKLSTPQLHELVIKIQNDDDIEDKDMLCRAVYPLILDISKYHSNNHHDIEDLTMIGMGHALKCVSTWSPDKGSKFTSYMSQRIKWSFLNLNKRGWADCFKYGIRDEDEEAFARIECPNKIPNATMVFLNGLIDKLEEREGRIIRGFFFDKTKLITLGKQELKFGGRVICKGHIGSIKQIALKKLKRYAEEGENNENE